MIETRKRKEVVEGRELRPAANINDEENDCWEWEEDCFGHEVVHYTGE